MATAYRGWWRFGEPDLEPEVQAEGLAVGSRGVEVAEATDTPGWLITLSSSLKG